MDSEGSWPASFTSWPESSSSSQNAFNDFNYPLPCITGPPPPSSSAHQLLQLLRLGSDSSFPPLSTMGTQGARARSSAAAAIFNSSVVMDMEESVLVMDGIPVRSSGSGRRRSQSLSDLEITSSSTSFPRSVNSHGGRTYKTEACTEWEHQGLCRHGSKCQFAHGNEELRPTRPTRRQNGAGRRRGRSAATQRSYLDGSRANHVPDSANDHTAAAAASTAAHSGGDATAPDEEEMHINSVLYGPSQRRRLPVFFDIAPSSPTSK